MKEQEKAKELVDKFRKHSMMYWHEVSGWDEDSGDASAEQCALICVDEMLKSNLPSSPNSCIEYLKYWNNVKQEIEKL